MSAFKNGNELKARLSALSPAKRTWLEQRLRTQPTRKGPAAVVQLQAGGDTLPVYFIYAGPEEILLAQTLGSRHTIFGIDIPWPLSWRDAAVNNETAALPTMERLVAPFVAALSAHVGSSPCVLVGYSFAGIMAFEAAHLLQKLGRRVEMVILIDTLSKPPPPPVGAWSRLSKRWAQTLDKVTADQPMNPFACRICAAWLMFWWMCVWPTKRVRLFKRADTEPDIIANTVAASDFFTALIDEKGVALPFSLVDRLYRNAKELYDVRPLNCRGVLFRANVETTVQRIDSSLGWKGLFTRGLKIVPLTGDHLAIIHDELHGSIWRGK